MSEYPDIAFGTAVVHLDDAAAALLRFDAITQHVCMECGEVVGGKRLVAHAREHWGVSRATERSSGGSVAPPPMRSSGQTINGQDRLADT